MNIEKKTVTNNFFFILAFSVNGVFAKTNSSVVARAERLIINAIMLDMPFYNVNINQSRALPQMIM